MSNYLDCKYCGTTTRWMTNCASYREHVYCCRKAYGRARVSKSNGTKLHNIAAIHKTATYHVHVNNTNNQYVNNTNNQYRRPHQQSQTKIPQQIQARIDNLSNMGYTLDNVNAIITYAYDNCPKFDTKHHTFVNTKENRLKSNRFIKLIFIEIYRQIPIEYDDLRLDIWDSIKDIAKENRELTLAIENKPYPTLKIEEIEN